MSAIDETMVQELLAADRALIGAIEKALADFDAAPPSGWEQWPTWRKPDPWRETVLPNLERYRRGAEEALREIQSGNPRRAYVAGGSQADLSKKMEFDSSWAAPAHRQAIDDGISRVVAAADRLWRIGHAEGLAKP
jgi:hypothetical protein